MLKWVKKAEGLGLALGGGAVKGFFHLGFLRVLDKEKIPIKTICGTSMGAIVGGLYCLNRNIKRVEEILLGGLEERGFSQLDKPEEKRSYFNFKAYFDMKNIMVDMRRSLPLQEIKTTKIPFAAIACDINTGERVIINEGPLRDALSASSNIPGILPPFKMGGKLLVDGIVADNVPVKEARDLGADKIIGIVVTPHAFFKDAPKGSLDVILRSFFLMASAISKGSAEEADHIITPDLDVIPYADFRYAKLCADIGEKIAVKNLEVIKKMIK